MKLKYFCLIFSIVGISILYFISELSQTPAVAISQLANYEGKQVKLKGTVIEHHSTKYNSQIIKVIEDNFSASIFLEGNIDIDYGDKIEATGEVQKYQNSWELIVNDARYIQIIEEWKNISTPLWELAENPSKYLGLNINITGYIESITNSNFNIVDEDNKYSLLVYYTKLSNFTITPGQKIIALGKLTFDQKNFRYKLEISNEEHNIISIEKEQ